MNSLNQSLADTLSDDASRDSVDLDAIFAPQSIALIGATDRERSVGRALMENLIASSSGGMVFPINSHRSEVLGVKAYPSLASLPIPVDLAVIATPAASVPDVIAQCVEARVRGAIIISAGFREAGPGGKELERKVLEQASRGSIRLIGPNCLGVMRPHSGLNATFSAVMARPGGIGFLSQSGALGTAILDWSLRERVGFSAFVSLGSMLDVGWGDLIEYFGNDPQTRCIVIYMESIGDARRFLSAAREVALSKPIVVLKSGRTEASARAVASHTGSMAGSDDALDAAFRRCGVLRVDHVAQLFSMAEVLTLQPRPNGPRLAIVTNAGGPGVLAADALDACGGKFATLSQKTIDSLDAFLPPAWSHGNPVDILGDADPERYAKAAELVASDPDNDGLLVILTPQAMSDPTRTAEYLQRLAKLDGKPILANWMGGDGVAAGREILAHAGIPNFPYPEAAVRAFHAMWRLQESLHSLYETPTLAKESASDIPNREMAASILLETRRAGRTFLTEYDSKRLLACYGIPTVETRIAFGEQEATVAADAIGYPVVLKLHSTTITHKTEVGGVRLRLCDSEAVRKAYHEIKDAVSRHVGAEHFLGVTVQPMIDDSGYELIIGCAADPQLGPMILFGTGGVLTEVYRDRALGLPPLNSTLALRMMERTKIFSALKGIRGRGPVDLAALEQLLVRFSQLVTDHPWIKEIDINPLLASSERLIAMDARVVVHGPEMSEDQLPRLAIRPFPSQYVGSWTLKNGTVVTIRPVRPEDEPYFVKFHATLSDRSVYLRYFHASSLKTRVAHDRLTRIWGRTTWFELTNV